VTTNIFLPSFIKKISSEGSFPCEVQQPNEEFISLPEPKPIPEIETFSKKMNFLTPNQKVKVIKTLLRRVKEKRGKGSGAFSKERWNWQSSIPLGGNLPKIFRPVSPFDCRE